MLAYAWSTPQITELAVFPSFCLRAWTSWNWSQIMPPTLWRSQQIAVTLVQCPRRSLPRHKHRLGNRGVDGWGGLGGSPHYHAEILHSAPIPQVTSGMRNPVLHVPWSLELTLMFWKYISFYLEAETALLVNRASHNRKEETWNRN